MNLRLGIWGLVLIGVIGCSKQSSIPPSSDWTTFNSTDAPFSVLLPSKPKRQEQSVGDIKVVMHVCDLKDFAVLTGVNDMPSNIDLKNKAQVKIVLDEAVKGGLQAQKATLKEQRDLVLQGKYPCREATASLKAPKRCCWHNSSADRVAARQIDSSSGRWRLDSNAGAAD